MMLPGSPAVPESRGPSPQASPTERQPTKEPPKSTSSGLAFLALLSFVTSFLSARVFTTLNPSIVAIAGGIHFHHFWYGLIMVVVAGWMGIAYNKPQYERIYAVVFGIGSGLIGDEVGLFLTLGNYNSDLTFFFFIIIVSIGSLVILLRDRESLQYDVIELEHDERLLLAGVVIMGTSALAFAAGLFVGGLAILGAGAAITLVGMIWHSTRA
jgi:hypothetical protein